MQKNRRSQYDEHNNRVDEHDLEAAEAKYEDRMRGSGTRESIEHSGLEHFLVTAEDRLRFVERWGSATSDVNVNRMSSLHGLPEQGQSGIMTLNEDDEATWKIRETLVPSREK